MTKSLAVSKVKYTNRVRITTPTVWIIDGYMVVYIRQMQMDYIKWYDIYQKMVQDLLTEAK